MREGEAARLRYRTARRLGRLHPGGEQGWKVTVRRAVMIDEMKLWYERAQGWQRLRRYLEDPDGDDDMLDTAAGDG